MIGFQSGIAHSGFGIPSTPGNFLLILLTRTKKKKKGTTVACSNAPCFLLFFFFPKIQQVSELAHEGVGGIRLDEAFYLWKGFEWYLRQPDAMQGSSVFQWRNERMYILSTADYHFGTNIILFVKIIYDCISSPMVVLLFTKTFGVNYFDSFIPFNEHLLIVSGLLGDVSRMQVYLNGLDRAKAQKDYSLDSKSVAVKKEGKNRKLRNKIFFVFGYYLEGIVRKINKDK